MSPLSASARATAPTDADYEAIREALMETARGRWFLGEYTKRNRNADTAMVLEAVARIEQSMAAAKAEPAAPPAPPSPDPALLALQDARAAIETIIPETMFDAELGRWRRSSRIVQEIAWALRETGSDPRICDILDNQVRNIDAACDEFPGASLRSQLLAALDAVIERIAPEMRIVVSPAEAMTATTETVATAAAEWATEPAGPVFEAETSVSPTPVAETTPNAAPIAGDQDVEQAPEIEQDLGIEQVLEAEAATETVPVAALPEPTHAPVSDATPEPAPSLGESLIAQGLVKQPLSGRADPLAPIRRMSQAEKIAFFS